jgi:hypothetical protein
VNCFILDGWEIMGLYEWSRRKTAAVKAKNDAVASGEREKSPPFSSEEDDSDGSGHGGRKMSFSEPQKEGNLSLKVHFCLLNTSNFLQRKEKGTDRSRDRKLDREQDLGPARGPETPLQITGALESESLGHHHLPVIVATGQIANHLLLPEATPCQATSNQEEAEENLEARRDLPHVIVAGTAAVHPLMDLIMSGLVQLRSLTPPTRAI